MNQLRKGVLGLQLYNAENKKWGQAHTQGAYVLTQYIYQNQKSDIIQFEVTEDNVLIHLNKDNLWTEGREMITKFLTIIQTYKSSGCIERAAQFYGKYSEVDEKMLQIRRIVIDKKKPRRLDLNNNLVRYNEQLIEPLHYPESFEGIIHSYADRFPFNREFRDQIVSEWDKTKHHLKIQA